MILGEALSRASDFELWVRTADPSRIRVRVGFFLKGEQKYSGDHRCPGPEQPGCAHRLLSKPFTFHALKKSQS